MRIVVTADLQFRRGLELFDAFTCPKLFVVGNHDLYRSDYDSRTL